MKKSFLILATLATVMMTACTTDGAGEYLTVELTPPAEPQQVVLTFSPYETEAMTRAAQSVSAFATRLDIWLFEDGAEVTSVHQTKDDDGFGTLTLTLDRRKIYTLYAIAHRSNAWSASSSSTPIPTGSDNFSCRNLSYLRNYY